MKKGCMFIWVVLLMIIAGCSGSGDNAPVIPPLSSQKAITAFSLNGVAAAIDEAAKTISVTMPYGTAVTALVATFETTGKSVKVGSTVQESGTTANNFTNPVTYTVTAADSSTQDYTVTVIVASPMARVPKTNQSICYDTAGAVIDCTGTGQDGELQKGVAWPAPRFTDNGDQTITDHLTGLMWTKDANAPGPVGCTPGVIKSWQEGLDYAACLNASNYLGHNDLPPEKRTPGLRDTPCEFKCQGTSVL